MKNRYWLSATLIALTPAFAVSAPKKIDTSRVSGIEMKYIDATTRPQDDFFRHVNGKWLQMTEIPEDKSRWGAFAELQDATIPQLRAIIESSGKRPVKEVNTDAKKISILYADYMNETALDVKGLKPLEPEFAKVAVLESKAQIPSLVAYFNQNGVKAPYDFYVHQDAKDSSKYVVDIVQSGLGLPDRDYYLKDDDAKLKDVRMKYLAHVEKMLSLAGDKEAKANAKSIVELETALAKVQWTNVENRDPVKTYNKFDFDRLKLLTPGYDWTSYFTSAAILGKVTYVIVSQPSYLSGFNEVVASVSLPTWKTYFKWHLLNSYASYLGKAFADEHFAFYSGVLRGVLAQEPRWKRAVKLVDGAMGEALGKLYVAKHFPPANKARMEKLVANLLVAFGNGIDELDWMSPITKKEAQAKLATFKPKIGYPEKWRDYSALTVIKDDLLGNVQRANRFEYQRNIDKLGKPVDRDEWAMTPQTVNAYYNPELNEIVFPAAILQPPFFNARAEDAVNYGAIGAVIGHEISHGFDDQGCQYDGQGNLRNWWTAEDHEKFAAKTAALVKQYESYEPIANYHVNGELTLGENIADISGLAMALKAYKLSLGKNEPKVIDGLSGEKRVFMGFNQVWRGKTREQELMVRLKTDPHSPPDIRGNATVKNNPSFYSAFDVKEGDKMFLPPAERVMIW